MEAIGTLAGGIAHDFNNILSAILGYAELASLDLEEGSNARSNLEESIKAGNRAKDLVQQILACEHISAEKAKAIGIREFVAKPVVMRELAKVIRTALDSPKIKAN